MTRKQKQHDPEKKSDLERIFETLYVQYGRMEDIDLPELQWQYMFDEKRDWEFDYAHLSSKTAIELDGGEWLGAKGGHTSGTGKRRDCEKQNAAVVLGWSVLRFTASMLEDDPIKCIEQVLVIIAIKGDEKW